MTDTWWTEPTTVTHHTDPPVISLYAGEEIRVARWTITLTVPTFTVTLQAAL